MDTMLSLFRVKIVISSLNNNIDATLYRFVYALKKWVANQDSSIIDTILRIFNARVPAYSTIFLPLKIYDMRKWVTLHPPEKCDSS